MVGFRNLWIYGLVGDLVVKNPPSESRACGLDPWLRTKISHAEEELRTGCNY